MIYGNLFKNLKEEGVLVFTCNLNEESSLNEDSMTLKNVKGMGDYKIYVYDEHKGPIPHFHLFDSDNKEHCCICIFEPMYFSHGKHSGTLKGNQDKALDKFFRSPCKEKNAADGITNWDYMVNLWNKENKGSGYEYEPVYEYVDQPDYRHMKGERHDGDQQNKKAEKAARDERIEKLKEIKKEAEEKKKNS